MGVNSLPKTVTRQRRGCDLNPGPSAHESSTLTTRLPSHPEGIKAGRNLFTPAANQVTIIMAIEDGDGDTESLAYHN